MVVEEDHVHVACVVHLTAAELAHREHHRPGPHADALPHAHHRLAEPVDEPLLLVGDHRPQDRLRDRGERRRRLHDVELAEHVADTHAELLRGLEGVDDRADLDGAAAEAGDFGVELLRSRRPLHEQAVEQLVDHPGIAHEQAGEERARRAELHGEVERGRVEAEEFPEHPLAAERIAHGGEIHERGVGVGRPADRRQQPRCDRREEVAAAAGREEPRLFLAERRERAMGLRDVAKAMPRKHVAHELGRRVGVEYEIHLRLGRRIVRKGVVEQMIEDPPVERGGLGEILPQPVRRVGPDAVAAAHRKPRKLGRRVGQPMRLAVIEDLQPVLHGAKERVGAFEDLPLLVGEAASLGEPADRLERVAGAHPRRVAAAQELQKLDRELDVADAAAAGLHVARIGARADRPALDLPLERLDAADVGPREPAAIDPGLHLHHEPAAKRFVAADAPRLHPGLPLPGAAKLVVMLQCGLEGEHRRPNAAVRPQAEINAVGDAEIGGLGDEPHGLLHGPLEKLLVRAGLRPRHLAVGGIDENKVDVARIVEFAAAELSKRDRRERRPPAPRLARDAALRLQPRHGRPHRLGHDHVGHVRNLRDDGLEPLAADDVAIRDPQRLTPLESPQRPQRGLGIARHGHLGAERGGERLLLLGPPLPHANLLPRLRVGDDEFRKVRAGGENLEQRLERGGIPLEERGGGERAADGAREPLHGHEHAVWIAHARQEPPERLGQRCEQVEREAVRRKPDERAMGGLRIGEPGDTAPGGGCRRIVEQPHDLRRLERHVTPPDAAPTRSGAAGECLPAARLRRGDRPRCRRATRRRPT